MRLREWRRDWLSWVALLACLFATAKLRPGLAERFHKLRTTSDMYALPAPEHVVAMSLGYRAALADLIWANVLVSYGLHFQEKRNFEFVGSYLDTINALDPKYEAPYRFADTLLTLQPKAVPPENYAKAREILLRGMKELPNSPELWSTAGQFLAYIAPASFLKDETEKAKWRLEGAQAMAHACEISDSSSNIPYHCIVAAGILNKAGKRDAQIQMLNRILSVNDDPNIQRMARLQLHKLKSEIEQDVDHAPQRNEYFTKAWKADLGFLRKDSILVLGPKADAAACSGLGAVHRTECAVTWRDWFANKLPVAN